MSAEVVRLTGTEAARGWLDAARAAETIEEAAALLQVHAALMRKFRKTGAPAIRNPARPQLRRQIAGGRRQEEGGARTAAEGAEIGGARYALCRGGLQARLSHCSSRPLKFRSERPANGSGVSSSRRARPTSDPTTKAETVQTTTMI